MIVIVDYGMGNLSSVEKALKVLGVDYTISKEKSVIKNASKIIIPGVGSFQQGMMNIIEYDLLDVLNKKALEEKIPIIGICLGMQLFCTTGNEPVPTRGLNWIKGEVKKINEKNVSRLPHLGWNSLENCNDEFISFQEKDFYFIHSYHFLTKNENETVAFTNYEENKIAAIIKKDNIYGFQFHPEKSQIFGIKLLKYILDVKV